MIVIRVLQIFLGTVGAFFFTGLVALVGPFVWGTRFGNLLITRMWAYGCMYSVHIPLFRTIYVRSSLGDLSKNQVIVIANHGPNSDLPAEGLVACRAFPGRPVYPVIKIESEWVPIGIGTKAIGGICIDRSDREGASKELKEWASQLPADAVVIIMADATRPTPKKREKALAFAREKYARDAQKVAEAERIAEWNLLPRYSGSDAVIGAMPEAKLVLLCIANTSHAETERQLLHRSAGDVHVNLEEIERPAHGKSIKDTLWTLWLKKVSLHSSVIAMRQQTKSIGGRIIEKRG